MQKFFDRKKALEEVQSVIRQIRENEPVAVWIEGHSGVGKTHFLEYIYANESCVNFFTFFKEEVFYKCERGSANSSFEFAAAIIFELQHKDPAFFERYIQDYFNVTENISFLDACCLILPQIKALKAVSKLIETKYNNITEMQGKISDRLVTYQLIDLFSGLILGFLQKVYKAKTITFCIDDAQWIDQNSIRVMENLIKKARAKTDGPVISIFLDTHEKSSLTSEEKQNYMNTYRVMSKLFPTLKTIYLDNFDYSTTCEVIQDTNRYYLIQQIPLLYKITDGNPLELEHTLRFSDERIRAILQKEAKGTAPQNRENVFTIEHIAEIYYSKPIYTVLFNVLSVLRRHISIQLLYQCTVTIYKTVLRDLCLYTEFKAAIDLMAEKGYVSISVSEPEVALTYGAIYRAVLDYLSQNGDYIVYGKQIADTLLNSRDRSFRKEESHKLLALKLMSEVAPHECFEQFRNLYQQEEARMEIDFFLVGADAFFSDYPNQNYDNICFAVNVVLPKLVSLSCLVAAQRICHILYIDFDTCLPKREQILFLLNYIKTQIDLSIVDDGEESAVPMFEKLYQLPFEDADLRLQALLLGMSAYEHILKHEKIVRLFQEAQSLVRESNGEISDTSMALFYRNKGLCFPHSELKHDYYCALRHTVRVTDSSLKQLLFGTVMNNLGLSFFYGGKIKRAWQAFSSAKDHLDRVGYKTGRVTNNIGVCSFMLHEREEAFQYFSDAASAQTEGNFMRLCIQTNLALSLYSVGKKTEAKSILDSLIDEHLRGEPQSSDTLVYCAALINRGYIAFQEKEYFQAADYYQKSRVHTYRFQNEEQMKKRETMRDISILFGIGKAEDAESAGAMDLSDKLLDFYRKPYSLVPFAFYVI